MLSRIHQLVAAIGFVALASTQAFAQAGAPLQLIVPYPAGGPTDALARALSAPLAKQVGGTVIVQNTAGASGAIASQKVIDAPRDGKQVLVTDPNGTILAPLALASVRFKSEDLLLVRKVGTLPYALVGRPGMPGNNVDELVAAARGSKGLGYGSTGPGSLNHLAGEDFRARTGLDLLHVPYKGGAPLLQDVMGGQLDLAFVIMNDAVAELARTGKLKMYGLTTASRVQKWEAIATVNEGAALKGFHYDLWAGLMVARGTPESVVGSLHNAVDTVMADAELRSFIARSGIVVSPAQTLAEAASAYQAEVARYRGIAKAIGLTPQ